MKYRQGTAYLVVRPGRYPADLVVDKATNQKPRSTAEGSVVIKLRLKVPDAAFKPLEPEAELTVPEDHVDLPVAVATVDPDEIEGYPV